jgi:hypothetical protein
MHTTADLNLDSHRLLAPSRVIGNRTAQPSLGKPAISLAFRGGAHNGGAAHVNAEGPIPLWNLYEAGRVPVSISYGGMGKYPPLGAAATSPLTWVKMTCTAGRLTAHCNVYAHTSP